MSVIKNSKGQITIFVIIAIVIIAGLVIFFSATDVGKSAFDRITGGAEVNIENSLTECIEGNGEIDEDIRVILAQGGNLEPEFSYMFEGVNLSYLCYTNAYYDTCVNQEPLLLQHVEDEIEKTAIPRIENCINGVIENLKDNGYDVNNGEATIGLELIPNNIIINIALPITVSKNDVTQSFDGFQIRKKTGAYNLVGLGSTIVNYEARFGESDPNQFMYQYPDKKVEKLKQGDGTTVYKVSDRSTTESFNFAIRSLVFPPGYEL